MHKRKKIDQNKCENPTFAILSELQFNGLFLTRNQYTNRKKRKWQINQKKYIANTLWDLWKKADAWLKIEFCVVYF